MTLLLTISYFDRRVDICLWSNLDLLERISTEDASSELITCIDTILKSQQIDLSSVERIGFLSGPGSFTSSRVVAATCAGIKSVHKEILVVPTLLNQAIHSLEQYEGADILLKCNLQTWHLYQNKWLLLPASQIESYLVNKYTSPTSLNGPWMEWPDISLGIAKYSQTVANQEKIAPYYGFEFPVN